MPEIQMKRISLILKNKWIKWSLRAGAAVVLFFGVIYISVFLGFFGKLPTAKDLSSITQAEATQVLDVNGKLIGKYYVYDRQPLKFEDFPKHLIDALIATEDIRFYSHDGVDNVSLIRVFVKNIILRDKSAGGGAPLPYNWLKTYLAVKII